MPVWALRSRPLEASWPRLRPRRRRGLVTLVGRAAVADDGLHHGDAGPADSGHAAAEDDFEEMAALRVRHLFPIGSDVGLVGVLRAQHVLADAAHTGADHQDALRDLGRAHVAGVPRVEVDFDLKGGLVVPAPVGAPEDLHDLGDF